MAKKKKSTEFNKKSKKKDTAASKKKTIKKENDKPVDNGPAPYTPPRFDGGGCWGTGRGGMGW